MRPDDVEELQADGRDAAEVARAVLALEALGRARRLDPRREAGRVHLVGGRREEDVDTAGLRGGLVGGEVARVGGDVLRFRELRRVDEEARDEHVAFGACRLEQRGVPGVQRAHRRHETERHVARQVELLDRADDDHGRVASASAL